MTLSEMLDLRLVEQQRRERSFRIRRLLVQSVVITAMTIGAFLVAIAAASVIETTARNAAMSDGVSVKW